VHQISRFWGCVTVVSRPSVMVVIRRHHEDVCAFESGGSYMHLGVHGIMYSESLGGIDWVEGYSIRSAAAWKRLQ
jgi:hypothetical protein